MITSRNRWKRAFALRQAIIPHVLLAGMRMPGKGEHGLQKFVCLSDDLDDVLYAALEAEAARERPKSRKKARRVR